MPRGYRRGDLNYFRRSSTILSVVSSTRASIPSPGPRSSKPTDFPIFALFHLSTTSTIVPPGIPTVMSPGSSETEGGVQRKTHRASSGRALTQPCDIGSPKLLCQNVEWIATPFPENSVVYPMPGRSYPPPVVPPLICKEIT